MRNALKTDNGIKKMGDLLNEPFFRLAES